MQASQRSVNGFWFYLHPSMHHCISFPSSLSPARRKGRGASCWAYERPWNWYALALRCALEQHRGSFLNRPQYALVFLAMPVEWEKWFKSCPYSGPFARPCYPILPPHSSFRLKSQLLLSFSGNMLQCLPRTSHRINTHHTVHVFEKLSS